MSDDKPTILVSSGFRPGTLAVLRQYWRLIDIPDASKALAYLEHCGELPLAVAVGHAQPLGRDHQPESSVADSAHPVPAHVALARIQVLDPDLPVVISTAQSAPATIVELIKRGAFDYVVEPHGSSDSTVWERYTSEFMQTLRRAVRWRTTLLENRRLKEEMAAGELRLSPCRPRSAAMLRVNQLVSKVAPTPATVLITGESGTGKEVIARLIHERSSRRDEPFLAINCGAMSDSLLSSELFGHVKGAFTGADRDTPGLVREVGRGTLLLDEMGTISSSFQAMLLRVLEQRVARPVGGRREYAVHCRCIAASNRNLAELVREGEFREDLYYRLNVFHIHLPPLRERREDIPILAQHFLAELSGEYGKPVKGLVPEAMEQLERFRWPGNVRQLRNVIERALILCEGSYIQPRDLMLAGGQEAPGHTIVEPEDYRRQMAGFERELVRVALERSDGNLSQAARLLNMKRTTLQYRIKQLELRPD